MTKRKITLFILIGILAVILIGVTAFFVGQSLSAEMKREAYFDAYRLKAREYIEASSEIREKYGEDITVRFDNSVSYVRSEGATILDRFTEVFNPKVPDTLEQFGEGFDLIEFKLEINSDDYIITFEKNDQGRLAVSKLILVD